MLKRRARNSVSPKTASPAPRAAGFTLIEIMVVVVILGILAALIAPNVINRIDDAQINRSKQDIRAIESALNLFRMDNFRYPTTEEGLEALVKPPSNADLKNWRKYLDRIPVDPWNREYLYLQPGTKGGEFDLYTLGADGEEGGEGVNADIGNWDIS